MRPKHPSAPGKALGLGLYIASEIARAQGSTLEVSSTAEETRLTFRMPLGEEWARLRTINSC